VTRAPIDVEDALARMGGDREFLKEILEVYAEDLTERISSLRTALDTGDLPAVERLGHAVKGASANLSLPVLREHGAALELAGRSGDRRKALARLAGLESEFLRLREHLRKNPL
jgi:HPt (histidine-containing phosphotransfer) domain-containing protein